MLMKRMAHPDHHRAHLRDLIAAGLIGREQLCGLPEELARRLDALLTDEGR